MTDIALLLEPTRDEPPCGRNLEYDAAYQELERAVQGKPEQVIGDHTIPAVPPNWPEVQNLAAGLLGQSKDLRIAIWMARALVRQEGLAGLASGMELLEGLLTRYWDTIHPQPDPDDQDMTIRLNALASLANLDFLLGDLRAAIMIQATSHEILTVRDVEGALGRLPATTSPSLAQVETALRDAPDRAARTFEYLDRAAQACQAIQRLVMEQVGASQAPDLKPLLSTLRALLGLRPDTPAEETTVDSELEAGPQTPPQQVSAKGIQSRQDALRMLDLVCDYLEKQEPSNPAPLLIRRAQKLMTMGFLDIIQDLAPDGLVQVKNLAGLDKG